MTAFELLALGSGVAFAAVGATVGVKLLRLSRRTQGLPERLIGASLFLLAGVAWPLLLVASGGRASETVARSATAAQSINDISGLRASAISSRSFTVGKYQ